MVTCGEDRPLVSTLLCEYKYECAPMVCKYVPNAGVTLSGHFLARVATLSWSKAVVAIAQI